MKPVLRMNVSVLLMLGALGGVACDPSDPCDPGYYEEHGACYAYPQPAVDAGRDASAELDEDGGEVADAAPPADPYEGFGEACEEQSDCADGLICGAPQLALCTQVNCMEDPSICPPGWTCFDTTGVSPDPSVNSVCLNL